MATAIDGLTPPLVWKYFAEISAIPRGSKHEAAIARYVLDTARRLGLTARQDKAGNVVVRKPASAGWEHRPSVCLQGHLDMVCEKTPESTHDFAKDPIALRRVDGFLMATGTTLGADNGIAVAASLAIMEDRGLTHGPLELLFTVDEETGLTGAKRLDASLLASRILLNLDSEEEGELYVGCAGGRDTQGTWPVRFDTAPRGTSAWSIVVGGLRGGHSGLEIDKNRGNAIKILARLLTTAADAGARVASLEGGSKRNAIPRDARAVVCVPKANAARMKSAVQKLASAIAAEVASVEPDFAVSVSPASALKGLKVLPREAQQRILLALAAMPHGVMKMSADIPGLVETSTNVAVLATTARGVSLTTSQRSSVDSEVREIAQTVGAVFALSGARVTAFDGYPGWKPNLDSPILKIARQTYRDMFGTDPAVKAVHAGLECGIIGEKYPGMDMISFGPTMTGVHSPDEKLDVASVPKFFDFLMGILARVP